jgi:hypothetical protein
MQAETSAGLMNCETRKEACEAYVKLLHKYLLVGTAVTTTAGLCVEDRSRDLRNICARNCKVKCTALCSNCAVSPPRSKSKQGSVRQPVTYFESVRLQMIQGFWGMMPCILVCGCRSFGDWIRGIVGNYLPLHTVPYLLLIFIYIILFSGGVNLVRHSKGRHKPRVLENRVLTRIFVPEGEEVTGENCVTSSFMICTYRRIWLGWSTK